MNFYKFGEEKQLNLKFTKNTDITAVPEVLHRNLDRFASVKTSDNEVDAILVKSIDENVISFIEEKTGEKYEKHDEEFVIGTEGNNVVLYADSFEAISNAAMTFIRFLDKDNCFNFTYIYDYPYSSFRGLKIYMPGRDEIKDYEELINMMVFFRHNTIMIEVGGAMEYKRHPEINEGWEEYCTFMSEYSGKAQKLQDHTFPWRKNSIHVYNGGGSYLMQDEVRYLIKYANDRGIKVIPEVPSSSHCDYMLIRRPDLAERCEDPYPDTFCLSNPECYELLFDIFDEVIDVFNPEVMNVGHDEFYSINVCDRCRKRLMDTHDLFAEDLTKIHDYLASKGVKTMFWCDKLLNVLTEDKSNFGGAINYMYMAWDRNAKFLGVILPTWQAREILPRDIICMNWFWSFGEQYDEDLREYPVVFGNFSGYGLKNYRKRCGSNTTGGMCSNWAATQPVYLQRNKVYFEMAYNEHLYWNSNYDDCDDTQFTEVVARVYDELFLYKNGPEDNYQNNYIEVLHTTDKYEWYIYFVDGTFACGDHYEKDYYLGDYVIKYTDGTVHNERIYMGESISNRNHPWYGTVIKLDGSTESPGEKEVKVDNKMAEIAYSTIPKYIDSEVYYKYLIKNPYSDKEIESVEFKYPENADWTVEIKEIKY